MRHAFIIIAHDNWEQLRKLIESIDLIGNDVFIHVNSKIKDVPLNEIKKMSSQSEIFFTDRVPITWGDFGICNASIVGLEYARSLASYDYYHLMTGSDLPLKGIKEIDNFFKTHIHDNNSNTMKSNYIQAGIPSPKMKSRVIHYNFFVHGWGNKNRILRKMATSSSTALCKLQTVLGIDRFKKCGYEVYVGSSWWSITDDLAEYIIKNKGWIQSQFSQRTFAADEFAIQTLVMNSDYKNSCFRGTIDIHPNLRLLDFDRGNGHGSPYVWGSKDKNELDNAADIFARKFDLRVDSEIVNYITGRIRKDNEENR